MVNRIGFACKLMEVAANGQIVSVADSKIKATTVAWLNRQSRPVAEAKLWEIVNHNVQATKNMLTHVSSWDLRLRQVRLGSDLLPMYTEPTWRYFWQQPDVKEYCEREFAEIGEFARKHDIRLSFHPGQFCVLASSDPGIVERSIDEFEYHVDMARMMGYGSTWHDHGFKINVHISGREGPFGIRGALHVMSPEARNLITIENDENSWGIDASLELADDLALVLDIHHHLLHSGGEYIQPADDRWRRVVDSWRGVRPVIHYSLSREDVLFGHDPNVLPNWNHVMASYKKNKLRAHSDDCWNSKLNEWALGFWSDADIQVEAKLKNIASATLLAQT